MALQLFVLLLALEVEDQDFFAATFCDHGRETRAEEVLLSAPASVEAASTSLNSRVSFSSATDFSMRRFAGSDAILFTTGADYRVHRSSNADPALSS